MQACGTPIVYNKMGIVSSLLFDLFHSVLYSFITDINYYTLPILH